MSAEVLIQWLLTVKLTVKRDMPENMLPECAFQVLQGVRHTEIETDAYRRWGRYGLEVKLIREIMTVRSRLNFEGHTSIIRFGMSIHFLMLIKRKIAP